MVFRLLQLLYYCTSSLFLLSFILWGNTPKMSKSQTLLKWNQAFSNILTISRWHLPKAEYVQDISPALYCLMFILTTGWEIRKNNLNSLPRFIFVIFGENVFPHCVRTLLQVLWHAVSVLEDRIKSILQYIWLTLCLNQNQTVDEVGSNGLDWSLCWSVKFLSVAFLKGTLGQWYVKWVTSSKPCEGVMDFLLIDFSLSLIHFMAEKDLPLTPCCSRCHLTSPVTEASHY